MDTLMRRIFNLICHPEIDHRQKEYQIVKCYGKYYVQEKLLIFGWCYVNNSCFEGTSPFDTMAEAKGYILRRKGFRPDNEIPKIIANSDQIEQTSINYKKQTDMSSGKDGG